MQEEMKQFGFSVHEVNGLKWATIDGVINLALMSHENNIIDWIRNNIKRRELFLDIGANVGCLSLQLSSFFDSVISVEPQETNLFALRKNIELNNIKNIMVVDKPAWSENTKIFLQEFATNDFSGNSRTSASGAGSPVRNIEMDAITIDSLNISPSFVKIDIEGAEMECLKGMKETLLRCKPGVLIEIHFCFGVDANSVIEFMRGLGYHEQKIWETGYVFFYFFE